MLDVYKRQPRSLPGRKPDAARGNCARRWPASAPGSRHSALRGDARPAHRGDDAGMKHTPHRHPTQARHVRAFSCLNVRLCRRRLVVVVNCTWTA